MRQLTVTQASATPFQWEKTGRLLLQVIFYRSTGVSFIPLIGVTFVNWAIKLLKPSGTYVAYVVKDWVSLHLRLPPTFSKELQFIPGQGMQLCGWVDLQLDRSRLMRLSNSLTIFFLCMFQLNFSFLVWMANGSLYTLFRPCLSLLYIPYYCILSVIVVLFYFILSSIAFFDLVIS